MNGFQNPYLNPYTMAPYSPPAMQPAQSTQVVKVSGENGARAFQMGPNSSALLLDESGAIVWLCTSDGAGYKTVSAYDITPHRSEQAVRYDSLEGRIKRLEEIVSGYSGNSSAAHQEQHLSGGAAGASADVHGPYGTESAGGAEPARHAKSAA